ncbi:MAG: pseudouridine synthase [Methylococcales symbiont of Hymedesmia sp. n. MRB-2018]|nr:MAG: pseudouridine synthase [Methylococcales symbiont of Hymedesmia sp. n. MRB-2018]
MQSLKEYPQKNSEWKKKANKNQKKKNVNNKKSSNRSWKTDNKPQKSTPERIQKVLARGGLASRREIERWIDEGRLNVNGVKVTPGLHLQAGDQVQLNGRLIKWEKYSEQATRVIVYNKPTGEVVTRRDPQGRPVVFSRLPKLDMGRWISVGRLDINTSGLLLLTNNGELANRLMHPSVEVDREYAVRILGAVPDEMIAQLKAGVELEDGKAHFDDIQFFSGEGANKWFHVVVKEGRNRLVRRLWESQGVTVSRLMRVRYGPAVLPRNVRAQGYYSLNNKELSILKEFVGLATEKHLKPAPRQR